MVLRNVSVLSALVRFARPQLLLSYDYARGDDTTLGRNPSMPKPGNSSDGEEMDSLPRLKSGSLRAEMWGASGAYPRPRLRGSWVRALGLPHNEATE